MYRGHGIHADVYTGEITDKDMDIHEEQVDHSWINERDLFALKKIKEDMEKRTPYKNIRGINTNIVPAEVLVEFSGSKSYREASRKTGIPLKSIILIIRKYAKSLEREWKREHKTLVNRYSHV